MADVQVAQGVGPSGCVALCGGGSSGGGGGTGGGGGAGCTAGGAAGGGYANVQTFRDDSIDSYNAGNAAYRSGNFENGIRYYQQALAIHPNNMAAYRNLGIAQHSLALENYESGNYAEAVRNFDEAVDHTPFNSGAQEGLVLSEERAGVTESRSGRQRACSICGKALIGDVDYGEGSSASLRTYVQQSQGKFQNCQRKFYDAACDDTRGRLFYRNLDSCDQTMSSESGFKSCVGRLLEGIWLSQN